MRNRRIFSILLCMVMLTVIILPVRADDRIYWHDDDNVTISGLGVYGYFEATLTGSGPKLTAESTLTYIPNSNNTLPESSYRTFIIATFTDNMGHQAFASPAAQYGMECEFTVSSINDMFISGNHISSADCAYYINNANYSTIHLP